MNRRIFVSACILTIGLTALVAAQNPPAAPPAAPPTTPSATPRPTAAAPSVPVVIGPAKVAWLDLEGAILQTEEGKREFGEIQKWVDKKNQELQGMQKELETLRSQLQVQGPKLTDEAREDLGAQIESKDTTLQRFSQDTQKEIENRRVRTTNYIGRRMLPVVEKLSKEKGLSAVQYLNPTRDAWVDPSLIITEEVIKAYNVAHPATASPAPPPKK